LRREITDVWLRGVRPPRTGRLEIWDARVIGLVLRVTPSGVASWSVRAVTAEGKKTRPSIGRWPAVGVAEARRRALKALSDIAGGADPVAAKKAVRAARAARAGLPTVGGYLAEWQATKSRQWSDRYRLGVARMVRAEIVPRFGARPLIETTRADWVSLITAKHRHAPGVGNTLYRMVSSFLSHAETHGWIEASPLPHRSISSIAPPPAPRERVLSDDELLAVWSATSQLRPKAGVFARLLIMTAARESEAADVAVGELDLAHARWAIPGDRTKNGRGIVLPLHPLLVPDLQTVWPRHGAGEGWRLLGDVAGSGFKGFGKLKQRVDGLSGVTGWRWHDLRRTARTGMTRLGVPREHAEAALNHVSGRSSLERTYDRHDFAEEVIAAVGRWQAHVCALVTDAPAAEVVPLRKQA
jgi:integrase